MCVYVVININQASDISNLKKPVTTENTGFTGHTEDILQVLQVLQVFTGFTGFAGLTGKYRRVACLIIILGD